MARPERWPADSKAVVRTVEGAISEDVSERKEVDILRLSVWCESRLEMRELWCLLFG